MNKTLLTCALLTASLTAGAQNGANIGMGGSEGNYASLAEKVAKIEKKNDAFNVYFNYAAASRLNETVSLTSGIQALPTSSCALKSRVISAIISSIVYVID